MPKYSLATIREAAINENKIIYLGHKVETELTNLGCLRVDIRHCIRLLDQSHFHRTENHKNINMVFDVYRMICKAHSNKQQEFYIKLRLTHKRELCVAIGFFYL